MPGESLKGIRDAFRMIREMEERPLLNAKTKAYIMRHEYAHRGSFWKRLRREVLAPVKDSCGL